MKTKIMYSILLLNALVLGCTAVSEDDLIEVTILEDEVISYNAHVKAIIDTNCISCHNSPPVNGAPMSLLTYNNVKAAVENLDLIDRISSDNLGFVMPFGGPRLPQAVIDVVIQWEAEGLLEE